MRKRDGSDEYGRKHCATKERLAQTDGSVNTVKAVSHNPMTSRYFSIVVVVAVVTLIAERAEANPSRVRDGHEKLTKVADDERFIKASLRSPTAKPPRNPPKIIEISRPKCELKRTRTTIRHSTTCSKRVLLEYCSGMCESRAFVHSRLEHFQRVRTKIVHDCRSCQAVRTRDVEIKLHCPHLVTEIVKVPVSCSCRKCIP